MDRTIEHLPIQPLYLWVGLVAVVGLLGILIGVLTIAEGGPAIVGAILILAGILNILLGISEIILRELTEHAMEKREVIGLSLSAIVTLFALFWFVLG